MAKTELRAEEFNRLLYESMTLREASAREIYDKFLAQKLKEDEYLAILGMDPTSRKGVSLEESLKGKYTDWLVNQYLKAPSKDRFLREDADQIKDGLIVFDKLVKNKDGLARLASMLGLQDGAAPERDIAKYDVSKIRSLSKAVDDQSVGVKDEKNVKVLLNTDKFLVVVPLTHAASRKWGTGTSWCTATSSEYHYNNYTRLGPLFIIVSKGPDGSHGAKWQYHAQSNQFMNAADRPVSKRSWFESFAAKGPDWEDAVDQVAETLEKSGCPKFSLESIFPVVNLAEGLAGVRKDRIPYVRNWDGSYVLTDVAVKAPFEEFLDLYDYIGRPTGIPTFRDILLKGPNAFSAPRAQHILSLIKLIDEADQSIIPKSLGKGYGFDFALVLSSFETFRTVVLTTNRLPDDEKFSALKYVFLKDGRLDDNVKRLLAERNGDDVLVDILSGLFQQEKLSEARARPQNNSMVSHLEANRPKEMTKDEFFSALIDALRPLAGAFPKSIEFLKSGGATREFGKDVVKRTGLDVVADLMKTGNELSMEDVALLSYDLERDPSMLNYAAALELKYGDSLSDLPLFPKTKTTQFLKSLETSPDAANMALFKNVPYTTLALNIVKFAPKSSAAKTILESEPAREFRDKFTKALSPAKVAKKNIKVLSNCVKTNGNEDLVMAWFRWENRPKTAMVHASSALGKLGLVVNEVTIPRADKLIRFVDIDKLAIDALAELKSLVHDEMPDWRISPESDVDTMILNRARAKKS